MDYNQKFYHYLLFRPMIFAQLNYFNPSYNFIQPSMNRTRLFLNKYTLQKQLQITDTYHSLNMKLIKPITSKLMEHTDNITINNRKRQKIKQSREVEIQRENKILLDKISSVIKKRGIYSVSKTKNFRTNVNKSLNEMSRKRQDELIAQENKRFLARLHNNKATMNVQKLNRDWNDNKQVIKRMSNRQFYLSTLRPKDNHRYDKANDSLLKNKIQFTRINKIHTIDGFPIKIRAGFVQSYFKITADCLNNSNLKVIQIPKEQAIIFLQQECKGKMEGILNKLKYDQLSDVLYISSQRLAEVSKDFEEGNPQVANQKRQQTFIAIKVKSNQKQKHPTKYSIISQEKLSVSQADSNFRPNIQTLDKNAQPKKDFIQPKGEQFEEVQMFNQKGEQKSHDQANKLNINEIENIIPSVGLDSLQLQEYNQLIENLNLANAVVQPNNI